MTELNLDRDFNQTLKKRGTARERDDEKREAARKADEREGIAAYLHFLKVEAEQPLTFVPVPLPYWRRMLVQGSMISSTFAKDWLNTGLPLAATLEPAIDALYLHAPIATKNDWVAQLLVSVCGGGMYAPLGGLLVPTGLLKAYLDMYQDGLKDRYMPLNGNMPFVCACSADTGRGWFVALKEVRPYLGGSMFDRNLHAWKFEDFDAALAFGAELADIIRRSTNERYDVPNGRISLPRGLSLLDAMLPRVDQL